MIKEKDFPKFNSLFFRFNSFSENWDYISFFIERNEEAIKELERLEKYLSGISDSEIDDISDKTIEELFRWFEENGYENILESWLLFFDYDLTYGLNKLKSDERFNSLTWNVKDNGFRTIIDNE